MGCRGGVGGAEEASVRAGDSGVGAGCKSGPVGSSRVPGTADCSALVVPGEEAAITLVLFSLFWGEPESPSSRGTGPIRSWGRSRKTIFMTCSTTPGSSDSKVIWALLGKVMDTFTMATLDPGLPVAGILLDAGLVINPIQSINVIEPSWAYNYLAPLLPTSRPSGRPADSASTNLGVGRSPYTTAKSTRGD